MATKPSTWRKPWTWDGSRWLPDSEPPRASVTPVGVSATSTTLASSATTVNAGSSITLTATVKTAAGVAVPSGSIQFQRNSGAGGAWSVMATVAVNASGVATYSVAVSATYSYRAVYVPSGAYLASTSGTVTVTAKVKKSATKTVNCSWSRSYQGDGDARSGIAECYQGYYSSTNGNQRSLVGFPSLGLPAGSTVTKAEVYLYAAHWGDSGGGTAVIGDHNYSSPPASYTSGGNQDVIRQAWSSKTGGKWITLGSSQAARFGAGTAKGVILGPGPTTSTLAYYGYFNGNGQSSEPQLKVTYEYWE